MLHEIPEFTKRIKDSILCHLFAPEEKKEIPQDQTQDQNFVLEKETEGVEKSGDKKEKRQKAVIQSLNFLSLSRKKSEEDKEFRGNLASFSFPYQRTKEGVEIVKIPYIVLEENLPERHGVLRKNGHTIQGKLSELEEYLTQNSEAFYRGTLLYPNNSRTKPSEEESIEGNAIFPFSAININIPWFEEGTLKDCINLPTPQEIASLTNKLTKEKNSQIALIFSGKENEVNLYFETTRREIGRIKTARQSCHEIATILVKQGYLCSKGEASYEEVRRFKDAHKFKERQKTVEKSYQEILKRIDTFVEDYIEAQLLKMKFKEKWGSFYNIENKELNAYRKEEEELNEKIEPKITFEKHWSELRSASQRFYGEKRRLLVEQEDAADKLLEKVVRIKIKETEKGEDFLTNIDNTKQEITKEYKALAEGWFSILQEGLDETTKDSNKFYYDPVFIKIILIRNDAGFLKRFQWDPINKIEERWDEGKERKTFEEELEKREVLETHLATTKLLYPSITHPKTISDPNLFSPIPKELKSKNALVALKSPIEKKRKIRIDNRLAARPDLKTELLLENDNLQINIYNPVAGKPTGIKDATLWRPIITKKGIQHIHDILHSFGYEPLAEASVANLAERKVKQAERNLAPNYPLTAYESLAYFENGPRIAQATILHPDTGEPLWIAGKTYHITPSWKRETMLVDHSIEEENKERDEENSKLKELSSAQDIITIGKDETLNKIDNSSRIKTLTERRINFAFATFITETEGNKTYEIKETVSKETISMEKERIALEIDYLITKIEELEAKVKPTRIESKELKKLETEKEQKIVELDSWAPMLEDFLEAFPPETPALSSEVYEEEIATAMKKIYARFAPLIKTKETDKETSLKDYQLKIAALGAVKRSHANSSSPGAGKTICSAMSTWYMGHHYNWVICPTIAMKSWAKELERLGLYHEIIGYKKDDQGAWVERPNVYSHMRELRERFHKRIRTKNRLNKIEPEYYIISAENVSLGGAGNKTYSPWHYDQKISEKGELFKKIADGQLKIPNHWEIHNAKNEIYLRIWSDRADNSAEIKRYGFEEYLRPVKFYRAIKDCPQCNAPAPTWSKHGFCNRCKHSHNSITKKVTTLDTKKKSIRIKNNYAHCTTLPPEGATWTGTKNSQKQYPLYKMMGKHVGCKIIDEIHNWTNFHSQHGAALLQVKTKDTVVLSGTLCKTHISELEPSLCQIYEPNSGEFPYSPWGMGLFKEQFETLEIENTYRTLEDSFRTTSRRRTLSRVVPEASNLTKLRALLHGKICSVGETEMEKVWGLKTISETIRYVDLQSNNAEIYENWERMLREAYQECKTEHEKVGMLRRARSQITNLAYACDGPEKLEAAIQWIQESMSNNQRSVIVGPSTRFYTMLCKALKERKIPFMGMGNIPPEKRFEFLNKFRDSDCPNFVSRIRLVNVNFNQLVCCQRILFTGIDPSPSAIRQMQKRLNRIGQDKNVHCTFLITKIPERNSRAGAYQSGNQDIDAILNGENNTNPVEPVTPKIPETQNEIYRTSSYEERLFALVLRREAAIKQTLQQADKQRDPQELYEMLKDRQTLNQLLQDIVENTRSDTDVASLIKSMEENPCIDIQTNPVAITEKPSSENILTSLPTPIEEVRNDIVKTPQIKEKRKRQKESVEPINTKQINYQWKPTKKNTSILQGEFFSF